MDKSEEREVRLRGAAQILVNAVDLFDDAKLLFRNESFARAGALAILAIEETAKFLSLIGAQPLERHRNHVAKHVGTASFLERKKHQLALRELLADRGQSEEYARLAELNLETTKDAQVQELWAEIQDRINKDETIKRFVAQAHEKALDRLKQRCLYVDLNADGSVASSPMQVTKDEAAEKLEAMHRVVMEIRMLLPPDDQ
jgi:AbiV family abortive infection protein